MMSLMLMLMFKLLQLLLLHTSEVGTDGPDAHADDGNGDGDTKLLI